MHTLDVVVAVVEVDDTFLMSFGDLLWQKNDNDVDVNYQGRVTASSLNCRATPNGTILSAYPNGAIVTITKERNGWGYTGGGWVSLEYILKITPVETPIETPTVKEDDDMVYYKSLDEVPVYYKDAVQKLVEKGVLHGTGNGDLHVSEEMCRILTILDRLGRLD